MFTSGYQMLLEFGAQIGPALAAILLSPLISYGAYRLCKRWGFIDPRANMITRGEYYFSSLHAKGGMSMLTELESPSVVLQLSSSIPVESFNNFNEQLIFVNKLLIHNAFSYAALIQKADLAALGRFITVINAMRPLKQWELSCFATLYLHLQRIWEFVQLVNPEILLEDAFLYFQASLDIGDPARFSASPELAARYAVFSDPFYRQGIQTAVSLLYEGYVDCYYSDNFSWQQFLMSSLLGSILNSYISQRTLRRWGLLPSYRNNRSSSTGNGFKRVIN